MNRSVILSCALMSVFALSAVNAGDVSLTKKESGFDISIDGKFFATYHISGFAKPIVYPIIGPNGEQMTRHYPMKKDVPGEASDHHHHKSLWFTHGDVNGVDFWAETPKAGKIVLTDLVSASVTGHTATIKIKCKWVTPDGSKTVCTDERTLRFVALKNGARAIDWDITVHASHGDVTFGDTKEGSMGIRTHPALRLKGPVAKGQALNSAGDTGKSLWGKKADWVDYWGPINGNVVGVAIFNHPSNPVSPTWWHARDYGLVAANPFGVSYFERKKRGTGDMKIVSGKSVTFRYRFLFHKGDHKQANIPAAYAEFAK